MNPALQDIMVFVYKFGAPCLFITITCNPKWEEIKKLLFPGQQATDNTFVLTVVFEEKVKMFMDIIRKDQLFGPVQCFVKTNEWTEKAFPHIHSLIWLVKPLMPDQIDKIICAEITLKEDKELFRLFINMYTVHVVGPMTPRCLRKWKMSVSLS